MMRPFVGVRPLYLSIRQMVRLTALDEKTSGGPGASGGGGRAALRGCSRARGAALAVRPQDLDRGPREAIINHLRQVDALLLEAGGFVRREGRCVRVADLDGLLRVALE